MTRNIATRFLLVVSIAALAGACATGPRTSVTNVYRAANIPNAPYRHLLVVGVAKSERNAQRFEDALVAGLANESTRARANHLEDSDGVASDAEVREVAKRIGADAIVITSIKRFDIDTTTSAERIDVARTRKGDDLVDFFRSDYKDITTPATVALTYDVVLTTDVFDGASGDKVYTLESNTLKAETTLQVIQTESASIANKLRKDRIVR